MRYGRGPCRNSRLRIYLGSNFSYGHAASYFAISFFYALIHDASFVGMQASEVEYETRSVPLRVLEDQQCSSTFHSSYSHLTSSIQRVLATKDWSSVAYDFEAWLLQSLFLVTSSNRVGLALVFEASLLGLSTNTVKALWFSSRKLTSLVSKQKIASPENRTLIKWLYRCCSTCLKSTTLSSFLWIEWICKSNAFSASVADALLAEAHADETPVNVEWSPDVAALSTAVVRLESMNSRPSAVFSQLASAVAKALEVTPSVDTASAVLPLLNLSMDWSDSPLLSTLCSVLLVDGPIQQWWISSVKTPESIDAAALILEQASGNAHALGADYNRLSKALVRQLDRLMSSVSKSQKDAIREPAARLRAAVAAFAVSANRAEQAAISRRRSGLCVQFFLIFMALIVMLIFAVVFVPASRLPPPVQPLASQLRLLIVQTFTKST
eukprot:TRINITY_DN4813_c0_g2_i2.p1 TRINITY_DN4813_c0_g2~~TRINITY_DN4813_c0_g2_i2.p1  ORF type:complete len:439 (-),score=40.45 TRINITY_DN4813_c0_g2_i2:17-1333(-)